MIQIFNVTVTVNDSGQYAVRVKFQDFHSNGKKLKYIVTKHLDMMIRNLLQLPKLVREQ